MTDVQTFYVFKMFECSACDRPLFVTSFQKLPIAAFRVGGSHPLPDLVLLGSISLEGGYLLTSIAAKENAVWHRASYHVSRPRKSCMADIISSKAGADLRII